MRLRVARTDRRRILALWSSVATFAVQLDHLGKVHVDAKSIVYSLKKRTMPIGRKLYACRTREATSCINS